MVLLWWWYCVYDWRTRGEKVFFGNLWSMGNRHRFGHWFSLIPLSNFPALIILSFHLPWSSHTSTQFDPHFVPRWYGFVLLHHGYAESTQLYWPHCCRLSLVSPFGCRQSLGETRGDNGISCVIICVTNTRVLFWVSQNSVHATKHPMALDCSSFLEQDTKWHQSSF